MQLKQGCNFKVDSILANAVGLRQGNMRKSVLLKRCPFGTNCNLQCTAASDQREP